MISRVQYIVVIVFFISIALGMYSRFYIQNIGILSTNLIPTFFASLFLIYFFLSDSLKKLNIYDYNFLLFFTYLIGINFFMKNFLEFPIFLVKFFSFIIIYLSIKNFSLSKRQIFDILLIFLNIFVIFNFLFFIIYLYQIFYDGVFLYQHAQYVFEHNIPFFSGLYESRTQFINILIISTGLILNLKYLSNFNKFINNNNLNYLLFFNLLFGIFSFSRGYFLVISVMLVFYFILILIQNFSLKLLIRSSILILVPIFILLIIFYYGKFKPDNIIVTEYKTQILERIYGIFKSTRFYPLHYIFETSFTEKLFGSVFHEEGIQTIKYGWLGFHNSLFTIFYKYGLLGLLLFINLIYSFFVSNTLNKLSCNFVILPLTGYLSYGMLHNNYNFFLIFFLIILQGQIFSRDE